MSLGKQVFQLSYGMSEMAASTSNDVIANALARVADKLQMKGENLKTSDLTELDKQIISYYHANK